MFKKWKQRLKNTNHKKGKIALVIALAMSIMTQPLLPTIVETVEANRIGSREAHSVQDDQSMNPLMSEREALVYQGDDFLINLETSPDQDVIDNEVTPVIMTYEVADKYEPSYDDGEDDSGSIAVSSKKAYDNSDKEYYDLLFNDDKEQIIPELPSNRRHPELTANEALRADYLAGDIQFLTVGADGSSLYYDLEPLNIPTDPEYIVDELAAVWEIGIHPSLTQITPEDRNAVDDFENNSIHVVGRRGVHQIWERFTVRFDGEVVIAFCGERYLPSPVQNANFTPVETRNEDIRRTLYFAADMFGNDGFTNRDFTDDEALATTLVLTWFNNYGNNTGRNYTNSPSFNFIAPPYPTGAVITSHSVSDPRGFNNPLITSLFNRVMSNEEIPDRSVFRGFRLRTSDGHQDLFTGYIADTGYVQVRKNSTRPDLVASNPHYSIEGTVIGAWTTREAAIEASSSNRLGRWITDGSGVGRLFTGTIANPNFTGYTRLYGIAGTRLFVRETHAPDGHLIDDAIREVVIGVDTVTTATFTNIAVLGRIRVEKQDSRTSNTPQGDASLAGATFGVFQPGTNVQVNTITINQVANNGVHHGYSGLLPLGDWDVRETTPGIGYTLNTTTYRVQLRFENDTTPVVVTRQAVPNEVQRGTLEILKIDSGNNHNTPQGDASLQGAVIAIYNISENPIYLLNNGAWNATTNRFTGTFGPLVPVGGRITTITTDANGRASLPNYSLPFGTYRLVEINPSTGYLLNNGWSATVTINQNRQVVRSVNLPQDVYLGGVRVRKGDWDRMQVRNGTDDPSVPQGDARLNATFAIYNMSEQPIRPFGTGTPVAVGTRVTTITADGVTGIAQTPTQTGQRPNNTANESPRQMLPFGRYQIVEIDPITGYHVTHPNVNNGQPWERTFTIRYHGQIVDLTNEPALNVVYRNNIMIEKRDAELRISDGMSGENSLAGIQYAIYNRSDRKLLYRPHGGEARWVEVGDRITVITTEWNELAQAYTAQTRGQMIDGYYHAALSFGRYDIVELGHRDGWGTDRANEFYYFTDREVRHVTIRTPFTWERDSHETATSANPDNFYRETTQNDPLNWYNYNIRNDFRFVKIAEGFARRMDVPWALTNITTGETQILVTNRNGEFRSYHGWNHNRDNLNTRVVENFLAVDPNEITEEMIIDWLENPYDEQGRRREISMADLHEHSGVWFGRGARTGAQAPVQNSLQFGALTYGQYILRELPSDTNAPNDLNEGYHLQVIEFEIMRSLPGNTGGAGNNSTLANGRPVYTIELGTVTNWETHVWSEAEDADTRTQMSFARDGEVIINDRIWYRGLIPGVNYVVRGFAMEYPSGRLLMIDGEMVESRATITALSTTIPRSVNLTFVFDGTDLAGRTIVFGAHIYREDTGQLVAVHRDITDEDQTILFPEIKTVLTDAETGIDLIYANGEVTVNERIEWSNLMANRRYVLTSYLYDADTGERFMGSGRHEFVTRGSGLRAEPNEGYATIQFTFNADELAGRSLVAVTTLTQANMTLAKSAELTNEYQTVRFPDVKTMMVDDRYGVDLINADGEVTLIDYVFIYNVIAGREYIVCGRLIDTKTLEEFHESVCVTFVPDTTNSVQRVEFTFDASELAGRSLVAFERLYYSANNETNPGDEDILIGTHEDPEDEYQTVYFPRLKTTAFDVITGTQSGIVAPSMTVRDRIYFWNLVPGRTFTIRGAMIDRDTGEAILYNGEPVTSEITFTPDAADGYVDLYFTLDSSDMAGGRVVIFESLYYLPDGRPNTPGDTDIPTERPDLPEDGILVGEHHDPEDDNQTIWFPEMEITTQAWTGEEPNQYFNPWDSEIEIHDNIRMVFRNVPERVTFDAAYQATAWGVVPAETPMGDISYRFDDPNFPDQYVFEIWVSPRRRVTVTGNEHGEVVIYTTVSTTIDPRELPAGTRIFWSEVLYRVIDPEAPVICPPTSTTPDIVPCEPVYNPETGEYEYPEDCVRPCVPEYNPETGQYEYPEDCVPDEIIVEDCIVDDDYYPQYEHNKDGSDRNQDLWPNQRPDAPTPMPEQPQRPEQPNRPQQPPRLPQTGTNGGWIPIVAIGALSIAIAITATIIKTYKSKTK